MTVALEMKPRLSIRPTSRFEREPHLHERELVDGFVVYDPSEKKAHVLSESTLFVWRRCEGRTTAAEIVAEAAGAAGISVPQCAEDVHRALRELHDQGLIRAV